MEHLLAAVDLGSNSFRLSVARIELINGIAQIYQIDRLKETVRLAAGLNEHKILEESAIERAISVLHRFGERLDSFHPSRVRAVATNTFRVARNTNDFLPRAETALGFPIEVIAGKEEARLIYTGVNHTLPKSDKKRLIIDIGGGSTEVIIGIGDEPINLSSLYMGCVSYSRKFFPDGRVDAQRMRLAELAARREIEVITKPFKRLGWAEAYGSSGTAKALLAILQDGGLSSNGITAQGLRALKEKVIAQGQVNPTELPGIKADRTDVLLGGLAIMSAFFDEFGIETMQTGDGALRLGVLVDLSGREDSHDRRDDSVKAFMKRYHVDSRQASRVKRTALTLFDTLVQPDHKNQELRHSLSWAADLHELGMSISRAGYHKHGAYILNHADMPGFSKVDQALLATLVVAHTSKLTRVQSNIQNLNQWYAILALRLAVLLCRRREELTRLALHIKANKLSITATIDRKWLANHPLSNFSLRAEESEWAKIGFDFSLVSV